MSIDTIPVQRLFAAAATTWDDHVGRLGPVPGLSVDGLAQLVAESGLTGRGGAGFPTARKLAAVAEGREGVVIANGAEGEPASSKDRALLTHAPHLVLDGLAVAVGAVGARKAYLYAPAEVLDHSVAPALRERRRAAGDPLPVTLVASPDTFISGQESAAVAAVQGRPAIPTVSPPAVYARGVGGRPTLVHNVETLAHLALIARHGSRWFRSSGTSSDPGTRLMTVSGAVARPGVYEHPGGTTLADALGGAGGTTEPVQAVLVGGYHGAWIPWSPQTAVLPLTRAALAPFDATPGAGVVVALPAARCGLQATADIVAYLAGQNAGQCGPCRNGLPALADVVHDAAYRRPSRTAVTELHRLAAIVDGRGACTHPSGTVRFVRSGLRAFADDLHEHAAGGCLAAPVTRSSR